MPCIFCEIIAGKQRAARVHEDAATVAIMDLRQTNPGHVLVLPKVHVQTLRALPGGLYAPVMNTVIAMTRAVRDCFQPDGINVWQSNDEGAFQEVPYVHFHVFPRWKGDRHFQVYPEKVTDTAPTELERLAEQLRPFVSGL